MRTAFITGATGFLALHIVEQLTRDGWRVVALHRPTSNTTRVKRFPVELVVGSITDRASLERVMPEGCDAVFHVAGNTSMWSGGDAEQTRDNVDGTRNMAETALAKKAKRFIHTSSIAAFGDQDPNVYDETAPSTAPRNLANYTRTKYQGELEVLKVKERGLAAVIMNPGHIIGPYDSTGWARVTLLVHKKKLPGIPPGAGSFADAAQVARAHIVAVDKGRVGERYLLGGTDATFLEMVTIIGELTGRKVPKKALPLPLLRALGRVSQWVSYVTKRAPNVTPEIASGMGHPQFVKSDKAIRELGYQAVPLETMLRECYDWLKTEGLLT